LCTEFAKQDTRIITPVLRLSLSPSIRLAVVLIVAHMLGVVALWSSDVSLPIQALIIVLIAASLVFHLRRDALLWARKSVTGVLLKDDGSVAVTFADGATAEGLRLPGSFVHPWFTSIVWRPEAARWSRVIAVWPDSLPADQFRELRVWLRWRRKPPGEGHRL
jgi:toxin CptA